MGSEGSNWWFRKRAQFPQRGNFARFQASLTSPFKRCTMPVQPSIRFSPPHNRNFQNAPCSPPSQFRRWARITRYTFNIIRTQYVLEVSSPGLDRPLRTKEEYKRFQNHLVKITTFQAVQRQKKFLGYLQGITDETTETPSLVTIRTLDGEEEIQIPYEMIASARLEVEI